MADLRVLHVSEVHWGGVVSLLRLFTQVQAEHGADVHVLSPPIEGPPYTGTTHAWHLERSRPHTTLAAARQLWELISDLDPDVIHLHSFVAGFVGRARRRRAGKRGAGAVVYQPHSWSFDLFTDPVRPRMMRAAERLAARRTDLLVTNGQDEIDEARRAGIDSPARILGVAVDVDRYRPIADRERDLIREELALPPGRLCVNVGRITYQKGQDLLVPAWELAPVPGAHLILVGPGDPEPLRELAPQEWGRTIHWVGEQRDVRPWLWAADLTVLPSRYEGLPIVNAESLACGRPVVATAVNGARDTILSPPVPPAGAVVPLGDMAGLLREIRRRFDEPRLLAEESAAGRQRASMSFTPGRLTERLQAAYAEAMRSARSREASR